MKKNFYTKDEIILCTYIARFGRAKFSEDDIHHLKERSVSSIKMKIQNIAAMLHENGYETDSNISKLTGKPSGEKGRMTNWDIVKTLVETKENELLELCEKII